MLITFTPKVPSLVDDEVSIELVTNDGLNNIFHETLGLQDVPNQEIGCREHDTKQIISTNRIKCYLTKGIAS